MTLEEKIRFLEMLQATPEYQGGLKFIQQADTIPYTKLEDEYQGEYLNADGTALSNSLEELQGMYDRVIVMRTVSNDRPVVFEQQTNEASEYSEYEEVVPEAITEAVSEPTQSDKPKGPARATNTGRGKKVQALRTGRKIRPSSGRPMFYNSESS